MQAPNNISVELLELSPILSRMDRSSPLYNVPEDYFSRFPQLILQRIYQERGEVPQGYFEDFAGIMMARIKAMEAVGSSVESTETEAISPLLAGISRTNPYTVPDGYFASLTTQLVSATHISKQPAKLVSFGSKWIRYAVAAAVAGVIAAVIFLNSGSRQNPDALAALSKVSDQEMVNYLQDQQDIPVVDSSSKSVAVNDFSDNDIKDLLSNVSDNDLEQYSDELPPSQQPKTN